MRVRDSLDVRMSLAAVVADALSVFAGFMFAVWARFDSGWVPILPDRLPPPNLYPYYATGAGFATLLTLAVFRSLDLYERPQAGTFEGKIPRLVRAVGTGIFLSMALAFMVKTQPPYSTLALLIAFPAVGGLVTGQRYLLFRLELRRLRRAPITNRVLIVGTDDTAARLKRSLESDPRLRSRVAGFLRPEGTEPAAGVPADRVLGTVADLPRVIERERIDQVIVTATDLPRERIVDAILLCDRHMIRFNIVPDLCRLLTGSVDILTVGDVPLLGVSHWPLDLFWNRVIKRIEDIAGSLIGLLAAAPVIAVAAAAIRRTSPGPVFYRQERLGERGRRFQLYKLRTMRADAEAESGPVWTVPGDPRRTRVGAFLRRHNLDELPQLWNVLRGQMSLVGPRPERPHFVEQFRDDVHRYMWRHVSKPGLTGWAQVNGRRGNTSIEERIAYDLFYLENWSPAFDFKILARTLFARKNAY